MKTLVFYGSPKTNSHTRHLLNAMLDELEGEVQIVDCYHMDISPCKDCGYCLKKKGCSIKDEMIPLYDAIEDCDAVIIATPMHFGIMSAPMYTVFTRLQSYWAGRFIRNDEKKGTGRKYGALLVTAGNRWMNMELLIEGVSRFAFDHMQAECIGAVYAKKTDVLPAAENQEALDQAQNLAKRLNELCAKSV